MSKKIPLFKVFMSEDVLEPINRTLMSGYIGQGAKVEEFENILSLYFDTKYISTVNCATSGIHLALRLVADMSPPTRNEVLTSPLTCLATNMPILAVKMKPKWVDVDHSCNMDVDDLRRKISLNTAAIMVVHWGGVPCDLDKIKSVVDECWKMYGHKPVIIEDCAHAFGSTYHDKKIGTHGNINIFSFGAIKTLTTGDGGVVVTPDVFWHSNIKKMRWYGIDRNSAKPHYEQDVYNWGYKFHMNNIAATIGIHNFSHAPSLLAKQRENAMFYREEFTWMPMITGIPVHGERSKPSYWLFTIRVKRRDDFIRKMAEHGIETSIVHKRNDLQPCFRNFRSVLPGVDSATENMVCIPCGWWVTPEDRNYIVNCIKGGW